MARYEKQIWLDHIVDEETGDIIQQGTVHSQKRMNHIEEGIYRSAEWDFVDLMDSRLKRVEDALFSDIVGNPFQITFENLEGLEVTGYWNKEEKRLEV